MAPSARSPAVRTGPPWRLTIWPNRWPRRSWPRGARGPGAMRSPAAGRKAGRQLPSQFRRDLRWSGCLSLPRENSARGSASPPTTRAGSSPAIRKTRGWCGSPPPRSTARSRRSWKKSPCRSPQPKVSCGPLIRSMSSATAGRAAASIACATPTAMTRSIASRNSANSKGAASMGHTTSSFPPMARSCSSSAATTRRCRLR